MAYLIETSKEKEDQEKICKIISYLEPFVLRSCTPAPPRPWSDWL